MDNNNDEKGGDPKPPRFHPKVLLIWLAIFAAIVGLLMVQTESVKAADRPLSNVNDLIVLAQGMTDPELGKTQRYVIEKATIQSDPDGGEEWHEVYGILKDK